MKTAKIKQAAYYVGLTLLAILGLGYGVGFIIHLLGFLSSTEDSSLGYTLGEGLGLAVCVVGFKWLHNHATA